MSAIIRRLPFAVAWPNVRGKDLAQGEAKPQLLVRGAAPLNKLGTKESLNINRPSSKDNSDGKELECSS